MPPKQYLLRVKGLKTYFHSEQGTIKAVDGVDFTVQASEVLGIFGEGESGKSAIGLSIMRLIEASGEIAGGEVIFDGDNLFELPDEQMRKLRGNHVAMLFRQPMTALDPMFRIGDQIAEVLKVHKQLSDSQALARAEELLTMVGVPDPQQRMRDYPHQLSNGMCQRVMIAMGLACDPELLIADEPTSTLDVTVQAQILELLRSLKQQINTAIILISQDLSVIAEITDNVLVMYAGRVMEYAPVQSLFDAPKHPYTQGLVASPLVGGAKDELDTLPGMEPNLLHLPHGCRFTARCPYRMEKCDQEEPPLIRLEGNRLVRCWLY